MEPNHRASADGVSLIEGESVFVNTHPSLQMWTSILLIALLVLVFGSASGAVFPSATISALLLGVALIARNRSRYVVTDERVLKKTGLLSRSTQEIRVGDMRNLKTDTSWGGNTGTISISTTSAGGDMTMRYVPKAKQVADTLRHLQKDVKS